MSAERAKKTKKKNRVMITIFALLFLGFVAYNLYMSFSVQYSLQTAVYGELENSIETNGFVIRKEQVINSPADGVLSCVSKEGSRVSKDELIANIYMGDIDESTSLRLKKVTERVSDYSNQDSNEYYAEDVNLAEFQIGVKVYDIVTAMQSKNIRRVSKIKDDMHKTLDRYKGDDTNTTYRQLLNEKTALEKTLLAMKKDIYSPIAGVFSSKIDGYEGAFDISDVSKIMPSKIDEVSKINLSTDASISLGKPAVKIFDNYNWYYTAIVDNDYIKDLKLGERVSIRFPDVSRNLLPANIAAINHDEDGRTSIVISCRYYEESVYRLNRTNCQIVLGVYQGIKVPKTAIRISEDGTQGVYIIKDRQAKYRPVNVLCTGSGYVIVKYDSANSASLKLYDEVIVSKRDIQDGQVIQ